jgi:hypothetical protein
MYAYLHLKKKELQMIMSVEKMFLPQLNVLSVGSCGV